MYDDIETSIRNLHTRSVRSDGVVCRQQRSGATVLMRRLLRSMGTRVATGVGVILLAVTLSLGQGGVATARVGTVVPTSYTHTSGTWWKCAAYAGWGVVTIGATAYTGPGIWGVAGLVGVGLAGDDADHACGYDSVQDHIGYQKLCGSKFLYYSPYTGQAVFDNSNGTPCQTQPISADAVFCDYIHPAGYYDICVKQKAYDKTVSNAFYNAYIAGAGGGGGGSW